MKISAIIIDDEHKLREVLHIKLTSYCPEIEVLGQAASADEAYNLIQELQPDLIFLDIQMPSETGFDLLNRFETFNFEIIFVTGYNEYALKALKVSAVDYILKPIETKDLISAVTKAIDRVNHRYKLERYEILRHNIKNLDNKSAKIVIPSASMYQFVMVDDIFHCEGWQKYTRIHLANGETILSSYNIGVFRDMLVPYSFFSTHKSHIVNMSKVSKYSKDGIIELVNGNEVPVSRRKREEFLDTVKTFGVVMSK